MSTTFSIEYDKLTHIFFIDCSDEEPDYMSTTNAQEIVSKLNLDGCRLFYRDTDGNIKEILHGCGEFFDFAPAPAKIKAKLLPYVR